MLYATHSPENQVDSPRPVVCSQQTTPMTPSALIEAGKAAQRLLDRAAAQTWDAWRDICLALLAIQILAMGAAKAEQPRGAPYHRAVNHRLRLHGFDRYDKTARSIMVEVARNIEAVDAWRASLAPERLAELNYPRVVLNHWKRSLSSRSEAIDSNKHEPVNQDSPAPLDAALRASSAWDADLWTALLVAKGLSWFRQVMPSAWRPQLQQLAGGQAIEQLKSKYPNKRVKRLKRRHLELVHDAAEASTKLKVSGAPRPVAP